jgi:hypothetical protein
VKRTELAITLILALSFSLAAGLPVFREAKANPAGMALIGWKDKIVVHSPKGTYNADTVLLNFTVESAWQRPGPIRYVLYNLHTHERGDAVDVTDAVVGVKSNPSSEYEFTTYLVQFNYNITNVADGTYSVTVKNEKYASSSDSNIFTVDTTSVDAAVIPEFPSWIILPILLIATLLIIICKQKMPKAASN